jgi:Protein of unknown function (DUF3800)
MAGIIPPQDFSMFADESGISNDRFTTVGGLCIHSSCIKRVHDTIDEYRQKHYMKSELKWCKVSNQKLEEYKALIEYFFALNNSCHVQFHSIVFDSHQWNHRKYNDCDSDIGLSKLYYQLILHKFARRCSNHGSLFVCLDHRHSSTPHDSLKRMVNNALARDFGINSAPLKQVISQDSKTEDLLQINDVVLGAVCAVRNGKHLLADSRPAKREIAKLVLEKSGLKSFERDSPHNVHRFTVWNMRPRPR